MASMTIPAQLPIDPTHAALCDAGRIEEYQSPDYDALAENFVKVLPALAAGALQAV
jgi:hypothetical protein